MKPLIFIPPAQAEALCDVQDKGRDDFCLADFCRADRLVFLPWRDEESSDDMAKSAVFQALVPAPNAQL